MSQKLGNISFLHGLAVILVSIAFYLMASLFIEVDISSERMFDGFNVKKDSYSYLEVGNWILDGTPSTYKTERPFLLGRCSVSGLV